MPKRVLSSLAGRPLTRYVVAVVLAVLIANALPLSGVVNVTPFDNRSGLQVESRTAWLTGQHTIDPNDGFTAEALGRAALRSWSHGHVPYWNANEGLGTPLAGEMQAGAFSPFVALLAFNDGLLYQHVLLELIAGIATLLFLVRLKLHPLAAATGAVVFALNGTHAWLTNAVFAPIAFLPIVLLGVEVAVERSQPARRGGFGLIATGLALSLVAGFPEVAFINGLLIALWSVTRLIALPASARPALLRKLAAGLSVGIILAAPVLVAFVDFLAEAEVGGHTGALSTVSLGPDNFFSLLFPYATGPIFGSSKATWWGSTGGYVGICVVLLAAYGLFARPVIVDGLACGMSRKSKAVLALFAAAIALRIYGVLPVLAKAWNLIPGIDQTAFYRYSPPAMVFALVILAAVGLDRICRRDRNIGHLAAAAGLVTTVAAVCLVQARNVVRPIDDLSSKHLYAIASVVGAGLVAGGVLFAAASSHRWQRARFLATALVACETIVLFAVPQLSATRSSTIDRAPIDFLRTNLGNGRFFTVGPIAPNYGSYFDLASINVNDLPTPKRWNAYARQLNRNSDPQVFTGFSPADPAGPNALTEFINNFAAYQSAGVRYLLTPAKAFDPPDAAKVAAIRVFSSRTTDIYELPGARPYLDAPGCTLTILDRTRSRAECEKSSTLTRLELSMPGWNAEVNGRSTPITTVNDTFQSIPLHVGSSTVTFTFEPPHIRLAWLASGIGFLVLAVGRFRSRRRILGL